MQQYYPPVELIKQTKYQLLDDSYDGPVNSSGFMRAIENPNISADDLRDAFAVLVLLGKKNKYMSVWSIATRIAKHPNAPKDILLEIIDIAPPKSTLSRAAKQHPQMQSYLPFE